MRSRSAWLAGFSCALVVAGCGSSSSPPHTKPAPRIPAGVAQQLSADADAVAASSGCGARVPAQKLLNDVIAVESRIPGRYREQLTSSANYLISRIPECIPPKQDHGKHKGHEKHGKHGEGD
jgi:hypothetical protein